MTLRSKFSTVLCTQLDLATSGRSPALTGDMLRSAGEAVTTASCSQGPSIPQLPETHPLAVVSRSPVQVTLNPAPQLLGYSPAPPPRLRLGLLRASGGLGPTVLHPHGTPASPFPSLHLSLSFCK